MARTSARMQISRGEAIERLREHLSHFVDDEHSVCQIAAEQGILCRGFKRYTDEELRERYYWLVRRGKPTSREDLEQLANQWQLARQLFNDVSISCDVQTVERDSCRGWDDFSDAELAEYCRQLLGTEVEVVA